MEQGQGAMGMNAMGNNYGGYPSAMTRNGKQGYCSGIYVYRESNCISLWQVWAIQALVWAAWVAATLEGLAEAVGDSTAVDFYSFPFSMNPILVNEKIPLLVTNLWFIESKTTII